jgi:hypothetical protein
MQSLSLLWQVVSHCAAFAALLPLSPTLHASQLWGILIQRESAKPNRFPHTSLALHPTPHHLPPSWREKGRQGTQIRRQEKTVDLFLNITLTLLFVDGQKLATALYSVKTRHMSSVDRWTDTESIDLYFRTLCRPLVFHYFVRKKLTGTCYIDKSSALSICKFKKK